MPGNDHLKSALEDKQYQSNEVYDVGKKINADFEAKLKSLIKTETGKDAKDIQEALAELNKLDVAKHEEIQKVLTESRGLLDAEKYQVLSDLHEKVIWAQDKTKNRQMFGNIFNTMKSMGIDLGISFDSSNQDFARQQKVLAKGLKTIAAYQEKMHPGKSSLNKINNLPDNPTWPELADAIYQYQALDFIVDTDDNPTLYGETKVWRKQFKMDNVASLQTLTAVFEDLQYIKEQEKEKETPTPVTPEFKDEKEALEWAKNIGYYSLDDVKIGSDDRNIGEPIWDNINKTIDVDIQFPSTKETYGPNGEIIEPINYVIKLRYDNKKNLIAIAEVVNGQIDSNGLKPELKWLSNKNNWYKGIESGDMDSGLIFIKDPKNPSKVIYAKKESLVNPIVVPKTEPINPENPNNGGKTNPDIPKPTPENPDNKKTDKPEDKNENPDAPVEIKPENLGTKVEGINEALNMNDYLKDWLKDLRVSDYIPTADGFERKLYKVGSDKTHYELGTLQFDKDKKAISTDATLNIFRAENNQDDLIAVFDLSDGKCKLQTVNPQQAEKLKEDDRMAREMLQKTYFKGPVLGDGVFKDAVDENSKVKPEQIRQSENGLYIITLNNAKKIELTVDPADDFKSFSIMNNDLLNLPIGESYTPDFEPKARYVENNGKVYKLNLEADQANDRYELQFKEVLGKEKPEILYNKKEISTTVNDANNTMGSKTVRFKPEFSSQSLNDNMLTLNNSGGLALTDQLELERDAKGEFIKVKNNENEISAPDFFDPNTLHKRGFDKSETLGLDRTYFESNFFTNVPKHVDGDIKGIRIKANGTERFYTGALDGTDQNQGKLKLDLIPQDTENQKIMERMLYIRTFLDKIEEVIGLGINNPDGIGELSGVNELSKEKFGFRPIPKDPEKYKEWIANHVIFDAGFKEEDIVNKDFSKIKIKNDIKFRNFNEAEKESHKTIVFSLDKDANLESALQEGQTENGTLELADPNQKYYTYIDAGKLTVTTESREVKENSFNINFERIRKELAPDFKMEVKREQLVIDAANILEKSMNKSTVLTQAEKDRFEEFWQATTKKDYPNPNAQRRFDRVYDALRGDKPADPTPDTRVDADKNINALLKNEKSQYKLENGKLVGGPDAKAVDTIPEKAVPLSSTDTPNAVPQTTNNVDNTLEPSKDPNRETTLRSKMELSNKTKRILTSGFGLTEEELQNYIVEQAKTNDPDNVTKWKNIDFMRKEIEERVFTADKIRTLEYRVDKNRLEKDTGRLFASKQDALDWFVASPTLAKGEPMRIIKQEIIVGAATFTNVPFISNYDQKSLKVESDTIKDSTGKEYNIRVSGRTCYIFSPK